MSYIELDIINHQGEIKIYTGIEYRKDAEIDITAVLLFVTDKGFWSINHAITRREV